MLGLPSTAAVRNAAVACVAGAGVALVGLSVSNVASIDGTLAAATPSPAPAVHNALVSWDQKKRMCPRVHRHAPGQASSSGAASSDLQY
jgi:hypothetical protein